MSSLTRGGAGTWQGGKRTFNAAAVQQDLHTAASQQGRSLHQHPLSILSSIIESELSVLTQPKCQAGFGHSTGNLPRGIEKQDILS